MTLIRQPWVWKDPVTDKKHKIWHTKEIVSLLVDEIEEQEQADSFFEAYEKVCPKNAEHNMAYMVALIRDPDIREDAADLFMINFKEFQNESGGIQPRQTFENKNGGSSLGLKVDTSEIARSVKVIKARKKV